MPSKISTQATRFLQRQRPRPGYEWFTWAVELRRLHRLRAWKSLRITKGEYYERLMMRRRSLYRYFGAIKAMQRLSRLGGNKVLLARIAYASVLSIDQAVRKHPEDAQEILRRCMIEPGTPTEIVARMMAARA